MFYFVTKSNYAIKGIYSFFLSISHLAAGTYYAVKPLPYPFTHQNFCDKGFLLFLNYKLWTIATSD